MSQLSFQSISNDFNFIYFSKKRSANKMLMEWKIRFVTAHQSRPFQLFPFLSSSKWINSNSFPKKKKKAEFVLKGETFSEQDFKLSLKNQEAYGGDHHCIVARGEMLGVKRVEVKGIKYSVWSITTSYADKCCEFIFRRMLIRALLAAS